MEPNNAVVNALLENYDARPTGFVAGQTITYGSLAPEFLYQRLGRPDPADAVAFGI